MGCLFLWRLFHQALSLGPSPRERDDLSIRILGDDVDFTRDGALRASKSLIVEFSKLLIQERIGVDFAG
jgi:hypothetical protein